MSCWSARAHSTRSWRFPASRAPAGARACRGTTACAGFAPRSSAVRPGLRPGPRRRAVASRPAAGAAAAGGVAATRPRRRRRDPAGSMRTVRRRARDQGRLGDVVTACRWRGRSHSQRRTLVAAHSRGASSLRRTDRPRCRRELGVPSVGASSAARRPRRGRPRSAGERRPVFARGVVWTPVPDPELRSTLLSLRDAGLNLIRVVGTTVYESAAFHDLCDELGLLVWQDLMFANMDYPIAEPAFRALVEPELRQALGQVAGRPSLAVVCGNSEVEQQVGMLGLDPEARAKRAVRRGHPEPCCRGGHRRDLHPVRADRRRPAVPDRSRRRELLRRRRVPPPARGRTPLRRSLRVRMPRLRERPGCRAGHPHRRRHARRRCRLGLRRRA